MFKSNSKKTVLAGLFLALGILLPFVTSHGTALIPGKVFLPMHIPVLLCGYFCGGFYGGICGFILPYLNSFITGMPVLFPNAVTMSFELMTYGAVAGITYKLFGNKKKFLIYPSLILSLLAGRVVYGIVASLLLFANPALKNLSVIAATISGIPGIIIQILIVPYIVMALAPRENNGDKAISMIRSGKATCVTVKKNKITSAASPQGIAHLIDLYDKGILQGTFVADTIVGKAAAMIFTLAGVSGCYGQTMSVNGEKWLTDNNIPHTYDNKTEIIQNRKGDGMCPMEATVLNIDNPEEGLALLRATVKELRSKAKEQEI